MENNYKKIIKEYFEHRKVYDKAVFIFFEKYPNIQIYLTNILINNPKWQSINNIIKSIKRNIKLGICKNCGGYLTFEQTTENRSYCSLKCANSNIDKINSTKLRWIETLGVDHPLKSKKIQEKMKQTNLERYGAENVFAAKEIKDKCIAAHLERYGVDNPAKAKEIQQKIKQTNLIKYGVECSLRSTEAKEKTYLTNIERYGFDNPEKANIWNNILSWNEYIIPLFDKNEYTNKKKIYTWKCVKCGNIFEQSLYHTNFHPISYILPRCNVCYPKQSSKPEKDLTDFCKIYFPNLLENNRQYISPYELDIIIPELKLAIELNGIYWHAINFGSKRNHHLNKTEMCEQIGYRLIHIWEDEWNDNQEKIKQKLIDIFTNNEIIDYSKPLDRCWHQAKQIEGYNLEIIPPEILIKNKFQIENCGYLKYTKLN